MEVLMKQIFLAVFVAIFVPLALYSQQAAPTPPKVDDSVVKISTNLIRIDVTVTDNKGKIVTGLGTADFELFENGERQKISDLSFVGKSTGGISIGDISGPISANPNIPNQPLQPAEVRRTIAIVVDDLNLSFVSVYYTRRSLRTFVDEQMQPNDLVAIIRTGGGVGALQQFTSDKRILHAAIDKIRWNPTSNVDPIPTVESDGQDITERTRLETNALAAAIGGRISGRHRPNLTTDKAKDYNQSKNQKEFEDGVKAVNSLNAIKYVIEGMNELPGRKSLMMFSDGMRVGSESTLSRSDSVLARLRTIADIAYRSSVVVYTFDTRGMQSLDYQASDNTTEMHEKIRDEKIAERIANFKAGQDGLAYFANQTGGKSLFNSNDLNRGIQRALDEQTGYYLIGYIPDSETFDASKRNFNKLEVKIKRPGLNVSYRSGFFKTDGTAVAAPHLSVENKMAHALVSPFASSEITLNINALYADDSVDGAYIRSFLHIDAKNLTFTDDADGWKKATFDVTAVTFGDNGVPAENKDSSYTIRTKGATYDSMLKNGFVYVLLMPVKNPGVYQYRVAVRDTASGKIGSASHVVEVPNLAKKDLAISSLAVEGVTPSIWQNIMQGKVGNNPGQIQVASTLLYDTVLRQFVAGNVLRYGYEVYNAKLDGKSAPHLETQIRILQNDKVVVEGASVKFDPASQPDMKHLKISGAVMLRDTLPVGDYVLQVIVNDTSTRKRAVQLFPFEIIK